MADLDATEFGRLAQRLGLINECQLPEVLDELGAKPEPAALVQLLQNKQYITSWQGTKLLKGDLDGYFLGGYRILYKIASGSFGRVHRAEDPRTGTVVAIKVLRRRWSDDPRRIELFEREGKVGLSLRHPNIVQMMAVDRDPGTGQYYMVMEFVEGGNLRDILAIRKKLDPREAIRYLDDSASALAYAYNTRGLTHRDVKPTNILISTTKEAKLVDFGLAAIAQKMGDAPGDGTSVDRTVDYAGLEKTTEVKAGDVRSDIFFLGCVFYEMMTGRPPMDMTRDRHARMRRARFDSIPPLIPAEVPGAPSSVFNLLNKMIAFDPLKRHQSPQQLSESVRLVRSELDGIPAAARGPAGPRTVCVVENHPKLQEKIRAKLKDLGFRVLLSSDAERALQLYQRSPYHAAVIDVGAVGEAALDAHKKLREEASERNLVLASVLLL